MNLRSALLALAAFLSLLTAPSARAAAGDLDPLNLNITGSYVAATAVQPDGKTLIAGSFTQVLGVARSNIARLNADGTLDTGFDPNANSDVYSVAVQADGKVLLGGGFTSLQPNGAASATTRNNIARLHNDAATQVLTAPDATQVLWSRSGAGPELSATTFEQSTNGGTTWTALGSGTRVGSTANWQLTGLSLPSTVSIRARGRTTSGYGNGSSGLIEQVAAFTGLNTPIQDWRQLYFGSTANSGNAADLFDADGDGRGDAQAGK